MSPWAGRVKPQAEPLAAARAPGSWKGKAMTALGSNAHIFAQPHRRQDLQWCFETALECGPVATVDYPGIAEPMLLVRFPDGGSLSIEFTDRAPTMITPGWGRGSNCAPRIQLPSCTPHSTPGCPR